MAAVAPPAGARAGGAAPPAAVSPLLARYAFEAPLRRLRLPPELREVSGLAATPEGRLFAHDDERAVVVEVDLRDGRALAHLPLGRPALRGDFEGLAWSGGRFYLMRSDGTVLDVAQAGGEPATQLTGLGRRCELEGLAAGPGPGQLLLACKEPRGKKRDGDLLVLGWPSGGEAVVARARELHRAGIRTLHPSGLERDLVSGHLLVVAARERRIVELAPDGAVLATRALPAWHVQAEGIALLPDGTLALADEGVAGPGHLTLYSRH